MDLVNVSMFSGVSSSSSIFTNHAKIRYVIDNENPMLIQTKEGWQSQCTYVDSRQHCFSLTTSLLSRISQLLCIAHPFPPESDCRHLTPGAKHLLIPGRC